jgi:predicted phosphoadenosine phosphosulfate sulfurtransferase
MKIVLNETVLQAARRRIRWLFNEFPTVTVNVSGGKDSTVVFHLALEIAQELGRTPLTIYWLDQEAEWQSTVDQVSEWMRHPDVQPLWLQIPFRIYNATSSTEHWLNAWDPAAEQDWIHPRDPLALTENVYGTDRFSKLFEAVMAHHFDGQKVARIAGVRAEESMARLSGLTGGETYGGETWGNRSGAAKRQQHYTFYPIYDWTFEDVWHYICETGVSYNRVYDLQFRYGLRKNKMRVSNLHHETAVGALFYVQEFEPETYARLTRRLVGVDMANKLNKAGFVPDELPFMFDDWYEYRDYLLEHLVENPDWRTSMSERFLAQQQRMPLSEHPSMLRQHVQSILVQDWEGILPSNYEVQRMIAYRAVRQRKARANAKAQAAI